MSALNSKVEARWLAWWGKSGTCGPVRSSLVNLEMVSGKLNISFP